MASMINKLLLLLGSGIFIFTWFFLDPANLGSFCGPNEIDTDTDTDTITTNPLPLLTLSPPPPPPPPPPNSPPPPPPESEEDRLKRVLKDAATEDKTVILTTLNDAWAIPGSVFDLFLDSFRIGDDTSQLLNHLVVVALDQKAYERCLVVHGRCFSLVTEGIDFSQLASFMSREYLTMMWRRTDFLRGVLELGYNFVFTDTDVMWFRNPFPRFYKNADFQISCDEFKADPDDKINNRPNGGYKFVRSNNRSIEFYKYWLSSGHASPGRNEQAVLNIIKTSPQVTEIGLKMKFLSTQYFGGICEPARDLNVVCTMHVNCCKGLDNKINDLNVMLDDWRQYMSSKANVTKSLQASWHVPQKCRL